MLDLLPDGLAGVLTVLGAIVAALWAAFFAGGRRQRQKDRIEGLERRVEREEIEDEIDGLSDDERAARLSEWMRDPK